MSSFDHNSRDNNNTDIVMSDGVEDFDFDFGSLNIMNSNQPAVVDAGEVTLVENTSSHPPPLPEPPPSIIDNNNGYKYSVTSIDGELILLV
jgi:hypothetical protein